MNPAGFSFPLNAYAAMLLWSEGHADSLHYGLFERDGESVADAQRRASERLWAQLPPPPRRVLDVGVGLGTTLARLREAGYDARGITPDARQAAAVAARWPHAGVDVTRLEDLPAAAEPFELMLFQESAQYIEPLAIFDAAARLLAPRATIVVMDEFALRRRDDDDRGLHLLPDFLALARRSGWTLAHDEDVTAAARGTLDVLLALSARHRGRLAEELALPAEQLDALDASNRRYRERYADGVYGYRVLRFERTAPPPRRPVAVMPAHAAAMQRLFARVFGRELGDAEQRWKYARGRGVGLLRGDGELDAFYGGLTRPLLLQGRPVDGCQVCDVMVAPEARGALARQGPLHDVTATFLEAGIGYARPHAVGYGFPNDRALGVAERLGLYRRVDEMIELTWPAQPWAAGIATVADAAAGDDDPLWALLQARWLEMAAALGASVLGVRDVAWLRWRYRDRPGVAHEWLLRPAGPANGVGGAAVLRRHADALECLDLVGDPAGWPDLLREARHHAAALGLPRVRAWITASHEALLSRDGDGAARAALNLHVPANAHTAGVPPEALAGRWLLMGGDTDIR